MTLWTLAVQNCLFLSSMERERNREKLIYVTSVREEQVCVLRLA